VKQPHTEQSIEHTDGQQNTGNHKKSGAQDAGGADRLGGTRAGAENVEGGAAARDTRQESVESGTDVDRVSGLDEVDASTKAVKNPQERHPERDEHGRL
jgi:hypothetical protein